jgi:hypothetical protein
MYPSYRATCFNQLLMLTPTPFPLASSPDPLLSIHLSVCNFELLQLDQLHMFSPLSNPRHPLLSIHLFVGCFELLDLDQFPMSTPPNQAHYTPCRLPTNLSPILSCYHRDDEAGSYKCGTVQLALVYQRRLRMFYTDNL